VPACLCLFSKVWRSQRPQSLLLPMARAAFDLRNQHQISHPHCLGVCAQGPHKPQVKMEAS
jgi:hypothetical protein